MDIRPSSENTHRNTGPKEHHLFRKRILQKETKNNLFCNIFGYPDLKKDDYCYYYKIYLKPVPSDKFLNYDQRIIQIIKVKCSSRMSKSQLNGIETHL